MSKDKAFNFFSFGSGLLERSYCKEIFKFVI